ncbi:SIMPL domain-containing protein [Streptomyces sp. NPDC001941]|uniref:SIMPL domain-containing protein n=1 Tax=Streptomyces sp. NPDC001941 TaxID=3154659 RepID=UPI00331727A8
MTVRTPKALAAHSLAAAVVAGGLLVAGAAPAVAAQQSVAPAAAAVAPQPTTVTVTGEGSASAAPDMSVVTLGVDVTRPSAKEALDAQSAAAEALLAAVRKQGVQDRDIRTESLSLNAVQQTDKDGNTKLTGYQATQVFSVKVRSIKKTGSVLQAAMDAAGDAGRVHGVAFDVADNQGLRAKARRAAHTDAHDKALQHARLSGMKLGRLVSLSEADGGRPRPVAMPAVAFDKEGVPVAPGEIEDQVSVTAVYELR